MSHIIRPSRVVTEPSTYMRYFDYIGERRGFALECDKDGNILERSTEDGRRLAAECLAGEVTIENSDGTFTKRKVIDRGVTEYRHTYRKPALLQCDCGTTVELDDCMTNTCHNCNADYNGSGQRLAPRSQWGEETGESLADIMMWADDYSDY